MMPPIVSDICEYLASVGDRCIIEQDGNDKLDARALANAIIACRVTWPPSPDTLKSILERFRDGALILTYFTDPEAISESGSKAVELYAGELAAHGLPSAFAGFAAPRVGVYEEVSAQLCIVTIHDPQLEHARTNALAGDKPIAIVTAYNEADVIQETILDLFVQGFQVAFSDNWSSDGTFEVVEKLRDYHPDFLVVERFPGDGPVPHFELQSQLRRKEEIAARFPGRWIMHVDADELRRSPMRGKSMRQAFDLASAYGANRICFTCIDFRLVESTSSEGPLEERLLFFEHGTRPGHFRQAKAWLQGTERVDLASSGGHEAKFPAAKDFPYRFLLKHYPIRSQEQGLRKTLKERLERFSPYERGELKWHTHYNNVDRDSNLTWRSETLFRFDCDFWTDHTFLVVTDLVRRLFARSQFQPTSVIGAHR